MNCRSRVQICLGLLFISTELHFESHTVHPNVHVFRLFNIIINLNIILLYIIIIYLCIMLSSCIILFCLFKKLFYGVVHHLYFKNNVLHKLCVSCPSSLKVQFSLTLLTVVSVLPAHRQDSGFQRS